MDTDLPLWAKWLSFGTVIGGAIGGLITFFAITWQKKRVEDAANLIRLRIGNTGSSIYSVEQIATMAGIGAALCKKALLMLEGQGFAKRAPGNLWQLGMRIGR